MCVLLSFISRLPLTIPIETVGLARKAMKDFTFSDGTTIPAGSWVTTAAWPISRDEVSSSVSCILEKLQLERYRHIFLAEVNSDRSDLLN